MFISGPLVASHSQLPLLRVHHRDQRHRLHLPHPQQGGEGDHGHHQHLHQVQQRQLVHWRTGDRVHQDEVEDDQDHQLWLWLAAGSIQGERCQGGEGEEEEKEAATTMMGWKQYLMCVSINNVKCNVIVCLPENLLIVVN